jgi:hypothetical protein
MLRRRPNHLASHMEVKDPPHANKDFLNLLRLLIVKSFTNKHVR